MSVALAMLVCSLAASEPTTSTTAELSRPGLLGWGLALEGPYVGVLTGVGSRSDLGAGYSLGGGLSWEAVPKVALRAMVTVGQTYGSRAGVSFLEGNERVTRRQNAEWFGAGVSLGASYLFRDPERLWTPYVGADAGGQFAGYAYRFSQDVKDQLESPDPLALDPDCGGEACTSELHSAYGIGWHAGVRVGAMLTMLDWLSTLVEASATYMPAPAQGVTGTFPRREVTSVAEDLWLFRATFAVRLGL